MSTVGREELFALCIKLGKCYSTKGFLNVNQRAAKPNYITRVIENVEEINTLLNALWSSDLHPIMRTKLGAIKRHNIHHAGGAYDVEEVITERGVFKGIKITVLLNNRIFIYNCGMFSVKNKTITGIKAYRKFKELCAKYDIDLESYAIPNGEEVKATIPKSKICMNPKYLYEKLEHVNHIDLNHAWAAGFIKEYPEFTPVMEELNKRDKVLSSMTLGYMQSQYCGYKYSHFSKAGIVWCNNKIDELTNQLESNGFEIIGYNTDGIWYRDINGAARIYHSDEERPGTGYWKTDHKDCEFYAHSDGQYWYREDGNFHVVARGYYMYEQEKARELWDEDDFYKAMNGETTMTFIMGKGFMVHRHE